MATTGIVKGTDFLVYLGGTAITHSTSASMSIAMDTIETSNKDTNDWATFKPGRRNGTASCDGMVALDATYNFSHLFGLVESQTGVVVRMGTGVSQDKYYQASAYITSLDLTGGDNESSTYSASFQLTGPVVEKQLT